MSEKEREANKTTDNKEGWKSTLKKELRWNKKLIVLKVVLFLFQGGSMGFLPYLTLHMQQLGITVKEIAIVYAFLPISSLLGPPISGIFADKFGRYKIVLIVNIIIATTLHCLLLQVPPREKNSLTFTCGRDNSQMKWQACNHCHDDRNGSSVNLHLKNCKFLCKNPPEEAELCYHAQDDTLCHSFNIDSEIKINGTLASSRENTTCRHQWYGVIHDSVSYEKLSCSPGCPIECQVTGMPQCDHPDDPSNDSRTFWIYISLRLAGTFFLASSFTMLDATTLAVIRDHGGDFGKQRVLNMIGQAVVPLISGILVDYHSRSIGYSDYMPAFYLGTAFNFLAVILVGKLQFTPDKADKNFFSNLRKLVTKLDIDMFLIMILVMGSNWGFIESYLFIYLIQLNAPNYMLGLTLTAGCIIGVPIMYVTDKIIEKLGRHMVFIISFVAYGVRQFGYANITDPWLVFPFEILEVFTNQIMWVAAVTYCPILAPKGLLATMTGLAGSVHYSLGRGIGSLLGGYIIAAYGLNFAFSFFGYMSVISGGIYTIVYYLYLKKKTEQNEKEREAETQQENTEEGKPMIENESVTGTIVASRTEKNNSSEKVRIVNRICQNGDNNFHNGLKVPFEC